MSSANQKNASSPGRKGPPSTQGGSQQTAGTPATSTGDNSSGVALTQIQKTLDILVGSMATMNQRIDTLEKKSDNGQVNSGLKTPDENDVASLLEMGLGTTVKKPAPLTSNVTTIAEKNKINTNQPETKEEKQKVNFRKSLATLQEEKKKLVVVPKKENNNNNKVTNDGIQIKQVPPFDKKLSYLSAKTYDIFAEEVIKYQMMYNTTIKVGAHLEPSVISELIAKNKLARDQGRTSLQHIETKVHIYNCDLEELEILVKGALAPQDVIKYEEKLKNYMTSAFSISEKITPRIYRFEDFFQAVNKYIEQFNQRIDLLSSTDIVLKMDASTATDGYDGSRKIFLQYLQITL